MKNRLQGRSPICRIGLLALLAAFAAGCASRSGPGSAYVKNWEVPDFELFLTARPGGQVQLSGDTRGAWISPGLGVPHQRLEDQAGYDRLKSSIQSSSLWRQQASATPQSMGASTGPPRDILAIRTGKTGICLQGSSVPPAWKQQILELAAAHRQRTIRQDPHPQ